MKGTKVFVAAVALCSFGAGALAATSVFKDVPADHWASEAIGWANDMGVMTGPGNEPGMFKPNGNVNRAELATVAYRTYNAAKADNDALEKRLAILEAAVIGEVASEEVAAEEEVVAEEDSGWEVSPDGMWRDGNEAWMRIRGGTGLIERSVDARSWGFVNDRAWKGPDGYWYRLDDKFNLKVSSDGITQWKDIEIWPGYGGWWFKYDAVNQELSRMSVWNSDDDGVWTDSKGNRYKATPERIFWQDPSGEWLKLNPWQWTAYDGSLYRYTEKWDLEMSMNDGRTWRPAEMWKGENGKFYRLDEGQNLLWMDSYLNQTKEMLGDL